MNLMQNLFVEQDPIKRVKVVVMYQPHNLFNNGPDDPSKDQLDATIFICHKIIQRIELMKQHDPSI